MPLVLQHPAHVFLRPAVHPVAWSHWPGAAPAASTGALLFARSNALRGDVVGCLGRSTAKAFGVAPAAAPFVLGRVAADIANQAARDGYQPGELPQLVAKARRVDGLSRFARSGLVSLSTTLPVALAAGAGALAGAFVGAAAGGVGAFIGAPLGAVVGAAAVAPASAVLSTAMYAVEARHRKGAEFTERVSRSPGKCRAMNALAYASGTLAANLPLTTAQGISSVAMASGLATTAIWGGVGLLAAPAVALGGVGVRMAIQEAMITRVPGRMLGLSGGKGPLGSIEWNPVTMQENMHRLHHRSTAGLVVDDMRQFVKLLGRELPGELRKAVHPHHGLKQTALNAALLVGGQGLGQAAGMGTSAAGAPDAGAAAMARLAQHGPGAAAWGTGRPVAKHGKKVQPTQRPNGHAL
ncbi:MAG: hypothetical protein Q8M77_12380 [Hydrogenophaga sp.]|nr:hypothetical protein [Hydrogenophaga sp.]